MTTSTRKGWQSHGNHAHVQTAMLIIAVVDRGEYRGVGLAELIGMVHGSHFS